MKKETLAEFLARGGKITIVPPVLPSVKVESIKLSSTGGPSDILSLEDAELYYGETKAKKAKKIASAVDLSAHLPEALRKKYVDSILNAAKDGDE